MTQLLGVAVDMSSHWLIVSHGHNAGEVGQAVSIHRVAKHGVRGCRCTRSIHHEIGLRIPTIE